MTNQKQKLTFEQLKAGGLTFMAILILLFVWLGYVNGSTENEEIEFCPVIETFNYEELESSKPVHYEDLDVVELTSVKEKKEVNKPSKIVSIEEKIDTNKRGFYAKVTAYSEVDSCHYPNCTMASNKRAYVGAIACPRSIKLGTKVNIEGLGDYTCEDRTAEKYDGRFDIFMGYKEEAHIKALAFGKQTKKIIIL